MAMLNWFKGRTTRDTPSDGVLRGYVSNGILLAGENRTLPAEALDQRKLETSGLEGLLAQLDDEGMSTEQGEAILIPWDQAFQMLENPDYSGSADLLSLPTSADWVPSLQSFGSLTDQNFAIVVADWHDPAGTRLRELQVCGAVAQHASFGCSPVRFGRP
jgi:hypothetical protein